MREPIPSADKSFRIGKLTLNYNAPFSLTFALISLIVLIIDQISAGRANDLLFSAYRFSPASPLGYIRLITYVLGHANVWHYISNITLLLVLGPALEERYGSLNVLLMTVVTALITSLIHIAFFPYYAILGASGIVYMMILLSSIGSFKGDGIPLTLIFVFIVYIGGEIYNAIAVPDNVSQLAHIVGGICGSVIGLFYNKWRTNRHSGFAAN